jgi:hypothetical protein
MLYSNDSLDLVNMIWHYFKRRLKKTVICEKWKNAFGLSFTYRQNTSQNKRLLNWGFPSRKSVLERRDSS